jgi:imidazolonepropionase-like amidohydrolase
VILANCLLFDGSRTVAGQALRVADGLITAVGPAIPAGGDRVVDLDGDCVLPGLVNMHVHLGLALPGMPKPADDVELALAMAGSARATLQAGVTTVRLVGESNYVDFALRRAIEAGTLDGPRVFTAGHALCCTGGHGWDADALEADGADGFRRATRAQLRAGADLIKVCISGGIAGEYERIDTAQLTDAELAAVIETAHDLGAKGHRARRSGGRDAACRGARPGLRGARLSAHRPADRRDGPARSLVRADDLGQPVRGVLRRQRGGAVAAGTRAGRRTTALGVAAARDPQRCPDRDGHRPAAARPV